MVVPFTLQAQINRYNMHSNLSEKRLKQIKEEVEVEVTTREVDKAGINLVGTNNNSTSSSNSLSKVAGRSMANTASSSSSSSNMVNNLSSNSPSNMVDNSNSMVDNNPHSNK